MTESSTNNLKLRKQNKSSKAGGIGLGSNATTNNVNNSVNSKIESKLLGLGGGGNKNSKKPMQKLNRIGTGEDLEVKSTHSKNDIVGNSSTKKRMSKEMS